MKRMILAVLLGFAVSTGAYATSGGDGDNTGCNGQGNPNSPCAGGNGGNGGGGGNGGNGGNGGGGGEGGGGGSTGPISNTNNNSNQQGQQQGQLQGQQQGQTSTNNNTNTAGAFASAGSSSNSNATGGTGVGVGTGGNSTAAGGAGGNATGGNAAGGAGGNAAGGSSDSHNSTSNSNRTGDSRSTGNSSGNVSVVGDNVQAQARNPVNTAFAGAQYVLNNDNCRSGWGVGGQGISLGLSFSGTSRDENCEIIKLARELNNYGHRDVAVELLRGDERVKAAFERLGKSEHRGELDSHKLGMVERGDGYQATTLIYEPHLQMTSPINGN